MELPLLKIETEMIPSLFCWNLNRLQTEIIPFLLTRKIETEFPSLFTKYPSNFHPKFFLINLLNYLFLVRNKYFINYTFLDKKFSVKNKFKYTHLNIFHITYINSNTIQQTLTICIAYRLHT